MSSGSFPTLARNFGLGDKHTVARESSDPVPLYLWQVQPRAVGERPANMCNERCRACRVVFARASLGQAMVPRGTQRTSTAGLWRRSAQKTAELQAIRQELAGVVVH